jgi:hypothetical protein
MKPTTGVLLAILSLAAVQTGCRTSYPCGGPGPYRGSSASACDTAQDWELTCPADACPVYQDDGDSPSEERIPYSDSEIPRALPPDII